MFNLSDIFGKKNVEAARNAYNNSSFKDTVDAAGNIAADVQDSASRIYDRVQKSRNEAVNERIARTDRENSLYAAAQQPLDYARLVAEDKPLEEASFDVPAAGFARLAAMGVKSAKESAKELAQLAARKPKVLKSLKGDVGDSKRVQIEAEKQYDNDLANFLMDMKDKGRQISINEGSSRANIMEHFRRQGNAPSITDGYSQFGK